MLCLYPFLQPESGFWLLASGFTKHWDSTTHAPACHLYDNRPSGIPLTPLPQLLISPRHQESPAAMQDQLPGGDAKVLPWSK